MKGYNNFLKNFIKLKYKGSTVYEKSFISNFNSHRKNNLSKILKTKKANFRIQKDDKTFQLIRNIFLTDLVYFQKKIIVLYRKFEINLSLKKKYNKKFIKLSDKETNLNSYVYLGLLLNKCKIINSLQKLNCILKIIDKILYENKFKKKCDLVNLRKLMLLEKKLINKLI